MIAELKRDRRPMRLNEYDYSNAGAYFVTICTQKRACLFGEMVDGNMRLNDFGEIVAEEWQRSADIRQEITLDAFVVMPNHFHAVVLIETAARRGDRPVARTDEPQRPSAIAGPRPKSVGALMAGFKSATVKRINQLRSTPGRTVWQRNYYDHVIRNEADMLRIQEYITNNPTRWMEDSENPARIILDGESTDAPAGTADIVDSIDNVRATDNIETIDNVRATDNIETVDNNRATGNMWTVGNNRATGNMWTVGNNRATGNMWTVDNVGATGRSPLRRRP